MLRSLKELIFALLACILITASYAVVLPFARQIPAARWTLRSCHRYPWLFVHARYRNTLQPA